MDSMLGISAIAQIPQPFWRMFAEIAKTFVIRGGGRRMVLPCFRRKGRTLSAAFEFIPYCECMPNLS